MSRYRTQVKEVNNRNILISLALEQGFNIFLPVYDGGVDFILYREADRRLRKVQLKSRWIIEKKYIGRDIWMAFPIHDIWYLMPHDEMHKQAVLDGKTKTKAWIDGGAYSCKQPSKAVIAQCALFKFDSMLRMRQEPRTRISNDQTG